MGSRKAGGIKCKKNSEKGGVEPEGKSRRSCLRFGAMPTYFPAMSPLQRLRYRIFREAHFSGALASLRDLEGQHPSAEERLRVPFDYRGKGFFKSIKPMQSLDEISRLYERVRALAPKRVLEIGTCHGGTLYLWCQAAADDAHLISVDLPQGQYGGGYEPERIPLYERFSRPGQKLDLIRGDSHSAETVDQVRQSLGGGELDFLFIDGDHRYAGVKQDFENYSGLVRSGGLIALHDICVRPSQPTIEVHTLWKELKARESTEELIERDPNLRQIGIGLVTKK